MVHYLFLFNRRLWLLHRYIIEFNVLSRNLVAKVHSVFNWFCVP